MVAVGHFGSYRVRLYNIGPIVGTSVQSVLLGIDIVWGQHNRPGVALLATVLLDDNLLFNTLCFLHID
jgi:hypothetical protein